MQVEEDFAIRPTINRYVKFHEFPSMLRPSIKEFICQNNFTIITQLRGCQSINVETSRWGHDKRVEDVTVCPLYTVNGVVLLGLNQ